MRNRILKIIRCAGLWFLLWQLFSPLSALAERQYQEKGIILIIASYNPDTKRMSDFISSFEKEIVRTQYPCEILIEDMGCKSIDEAPVWKERLAELLKIYDNKQLRGIILLGQEAWASFLSQKEIPQGVPFFACFASRNGFVLPDEAVNFDRWNPVSIDMVHRADSLGTGGGYANVYDIGKNIELIRLFYPGVRHIAFVSDNTYGGISLQAYFMEEMKKYPELDVILIDCRKYTSQHAEKLVRDLPPNTVLLIGTWRVDKNGLYFLNSSTESLISGNPSIPVFTLSGAALGTIAIGGYVPRYEINAGDVVHQIMEYHAGQPDSVYFSPVAGQYQFDKRKLDKLGIKEYQLPANSVLVNSVEAKLRLYEYYIYSGSLALFILILFLIFLFILYYRNKKLKNILEEREADLIVAKDKAEESDRLKSAFLANMSHEIRTPLNSIVGFSSLLSDESLSSEEKVQYSAIINKNSELLLTLINDVLDISRLETGRTTFIYKPEDVFQLCQQVMATTAHARKEGVQYVYKPGRESYILGTDIQRLSQVLINLMTNANKFTEKGTITLAFEVQEDRNRVVFSVTDTGCGIPKEKQKKVFNRFEKLNEYQQGTGLGLAICKQIATIIGGDIYVDPDYTEGARFVFVHPIHRNVKSVKD